MISGVLRLGDRTVRGLMTPRTDVDWIDLDDGEEAIRELLIGTPHSRLPVSEGTPDNVIIRIDARRNHHKGETLYVTTDPQHVHVFDTDTGQRLSK